VERDINATLPGGVPWTREKCAVLWPHIAFTLGRKEKSRREARGGKKNFKEGKGRGH